MRILTLECSFCRKTEDQVAKLVAGPAVYICDECVAVASKIMEGSAPTDARARRPALERLKSFCRRLLQKNVLFVATTTRILPSER